MQIKKCPKCSAENRPHRASCSNCYNSLEEVAITTIEEREQVLDQTQPSQPTKPSTPPNEQPRPKENPYGPPPGAPRPGFRPPMRQGPNWGAIILVISLLMILLLVGVAFVGWQFFMKPLPPDRVVQEFLQAAKDSDYDKFKSHLTAESIDLAIKDGGIGITADALKKQASMNGTFEPSTIIYGKPIFEGDNKAIVTVEPKDKPPLLPGMPPQLANMKGEFVLLRENGQWKVDLKLTIQRTLDNIMKMGGFKP